MATLQPSCGTVQARAAPQVSLSFVSSRREVSVRPASRGSASLASPFAGVRVIAVSSNAAVASSSSGRLALRAGEQYEVELEKPWGIKFYQGEDGGTYVESLYENQSAARTGLVKEGDRVIATSAVFGNEMWPAAEYGRTMYTVRNRIGTLLVRLEAVEERVPPATKEAYLADRAVGQVTDAVREKQVENYTKKKAMEQQRIEELETGLALYGKGKYAEAKQRFQIIMGLSPEYQEAGVVFYNLACCCSKLNQIDEGLVALESAFQSGFEDYKKVRQDPDLSNVRNTDEFDELMDKYDEPFINEGAIKALSSVFGFFGKK